MRAGVLGHRLIQAECCGPASASGQALEVWVGPGGVVPLWSDESERARGSCVDVLLCCRAGAGAVLVCLPEAAMILPLFLRPTHVPR
jgi:hypothetical protein